MRHKQ